MTSKGDARCTYLLNSDASIWAFKLVRAKHVNIDEKSHVTSRKAAMPVRYLEANHTLCEGRCCVGANECIAALWQDTLDFKVQKREMYIQIIKELLKKVYWHIEGAILPQVIGEAPVLLIIVIEETNQDHSNGMAVKMINRHRVNFKQTVLTLKTRWGTLK
jgi:hypothetical protein